MDIKVSDKGGATTVSVSGRIDIPGAERLKQTLDEVAARNPKEVILDFGGVDFIGSSGIGKLLLFAQGLTSRGGRARIVNLNKEIKVVFASAKLDKLFNI
jgi:anti-anti-sigma factor